MVKDKRLSAKAGKVKKGDERMINEKYVRFDWAMKRMLRDKANFDVLEGLMTVLFGEEITIVELLESEGNQEREDDKYNRVDIKAKNSHGEIIIVEIQLSRDYEYLKRILYGVAKNIVEYVDLGQGYSDVKKVYSINIVYFNFGEGKDYLYHGQATLKGVFQHDTLQMNSKAKNFLKWAKPEDVFPEYYLIRVNEFNQLAKTPIEEWLDYLKDGHIRDNTNVPGLQAAREKLQYIKMSRAEQLAYESHLDAVAAMNSAIWTSHAEGKAEGFAEGEVKGREEGRAEGREEGRAEERMEMARKMKAKGYSAEDLSEITGISLEEIEAM